MAGHELATTRHERTELFVYDLAVRVDRQRRGIGGRPAEVTMFDLGSE
jgi:hypothetical protein